MISENESNTVSEPLISVIIAVLNGERYLEQAIESVLSQTYPKIELLIVDGGSSDNTMQIIKKFGKKIDYWKSEPDDGIYDAWNKGLRVSKGEWISFVGFDDILMKDAFQDYINFLKSNRGKDLEFISSQAEIVTPDLKFIRQFGEAWHWESHKRRMKVLHVGAFHHRSLFNKYGLFNTKYKIVGDYEFLLRPKSNLKAGYISKITVKMRTGGMSVRNNKVHDEAMRAKIESGARNKIIARAEKYLSIVKLNLKQILSFH